MKNNKLKAIFLAAVALAVLVFSWSYINNYLQRSKASGDTVSIAFNPAATSGTAGQSKTVDILITAQNQKKLSGIDLTLKSEGATKITDVSGPIPLSGATDTFTKIIKNVTATQARIAYTAAKPEAELPGAVKVTVTLEVGAGKITIDQGATQIVGTASGNSFALGQVGELVVSVGGNITGVQGPPITLRFDPSSNVVSVGNNFTTSFKIDAPANGKKISAFSVVIGYDPSQIEITGVGEPDAKYTKLRKEINNTNGKIFLDYIAPLAQEDLPTTASMGISAKGKAVGTGALTLTNVKVTGNIPENDYSPQPQNGTYTVTATSTTTPPVCATPPTCQNGQTLMHGDPGPSGPFCPSWFCSGPTGIPTGQPSGQPTSRPGNLTINLKLKFQGIVKRLPEQTTTMPIAVKLAGGGLSTPTPYRIFQFTSDANGVWSGVASFDAPAGSGYRIYIKGPKQLAKKICTVSPSETAPGTYRCSDGAITLGDGANSVDASKIVLLSGDLPEQGTEGQNGVVDAFDVSFVRNNLGSKEARALTIGDLNLDGIIDTQDFSLILASLSIKYDEE